MGYGSESVSGRHTIPGLGSAKMGKASGGGVKLDKQPPGKISEMQDSVLKGEQTRKENDECGIGVLDR